MAKAKKKSFKNKFATEQENSVKVKMFSGEVVELKFRNIVGTEAYDEVAQIVKRVIDRGKAEGEKEKTTEEEDKVLVDETEKDVARLLPLLLKVEDYDISDMTEDDWIQFLRNCGGTTGKLSIKALSSLGAFALMEDSKDLPLSSRETAV